jgi:hypothetical protein
VLYQQDAGLPLQKATLSLTAAPPRGFTYRAALVYEGEYNELNQPRFVTLAASLGYRWKAYEVMLSGTNLTNVYDQRFINTNGGIAYGLVGQPPQVTNSYALAGTALRLSIARRF